MHLELAVVLTCDADGCRVKPVESGAEYTARYSAMIRARGLGIHPGQLVAVDMDPPVPEISWRWHRVKVIETGESQVMVDNRGQQISAARVPGLPVTIQPGDEVWITGLGGDFELHGQVVDGNLANPAHMREKILPRVVRLLAEMQKTRSSAGASG